MNRTFEMPESDRSTVTDRIDAKNDRIDKNYMNFGLKLYNNLI